MLVVRPVRPADLDGVATIYTHYVLNSLATFETEPPDAHWWRNRMQAVAAAGWPFLVAVDSGQVLGYAYVSQYRARPAYAWTVEDSVYVAPEHAGRGIGRELLAALLDDAATAGARQVVAVISSDVAAASVALHARAGFVEVGRLRSVGFKLGRWSDTTLMQLTLPSASQAAPPD